MTSSDHSVAELLELRVRLRGRPNALRFVDRALALAARAEASCDADELAAIQCLIAVLSADLALRFGAPKDRVLQ